MAKVLSTTVNKTGKSNKNERERKVLFGLVEHYIKTGKPVGSVTLKEAGFEDLSSATLRNYFANLEDAGLLTQQHASGGRIPTPQAFKLYAADVLDKGILDAKTEKEIRALGLIETKEIIRALHKTTEELSKFSNSAAFITAPRFDHDTILDVKVVPLDTTRLLIVLLTDFGQTLTEILYAEKPIHNFGAKRIESYFKSRLFNQPKPENLEPEEERIALKFYNEAIVRYLVGYSQFKHEELFKTGFSKLLSHPEFHDPMALSSGLQLFENDHTLRLLCREGLKLNTLKTWIGSDLTSYSVPSSTISLVMIPYRVNQRPVGVMGVIGPVRMPYRELFGLLHAFADATSHLMTHNLYKFKIALKNAFFLEGPEFKLLENKGKK